MKKMPIIIIFIITKEKLQDLLQYSARLYEKFKSWQASENDNNEQRPL